MNSRIFIEVLGIAMCVSVGTWAATTGGPAYVPPRATTTAPPPGMISGQNTSPSTPGNQIPPNRPGAVPMPGSAIDGPGLFSPFAGTSPYPVDQPPRAPTPILGNATPAPLPTAPAATPSHFSF